MKITKKLIEDLALISAIIAAAPYLVICLAGFAFIFSEFDFELINLLLMSVCLLGVFGYIGFLSVVFNGTDKKRKQSLTLLSIGIAVSLLVMIIPGALHYNSPQIPIFEDFFDFLVTIWPVIVVIYFVIKISQKLIQEKRKV
ncbi:MAG: hypothetical protein ABF242_02555 [Flavobacteriales bacterium]